MSENTYPLHLNKYYFYLKKPVKSAKLFLYLYQLSYHLLTTCIRVLLEMNRYRKILKNFPVNYGNKTSIDGLHVGDIYLCLRQVTSVAIVVLHFFSNNFKITLPSTRSSSE
jgi:hypothetical protein